METQEANGSGTADRIQSGGRRNCGTRDTRGAVPSQVRESACEGVRVAASHRHVHTMIVPNGIRRGGRLRLQLPPKSISCVTPSLQILQ